MDRQFARDILVVHVMVNLIRHDLKNVVDLDPKSCPCY